MGGSTEGWNKFPPILLLYLAEREGELRSEEEGKRGKQAKKNKQI